MNKNTNKPFLDLGGHPLLDFCNTFVIHSNSIEDRLKSKDDLKSFFKYFYKINFNVTSVHLKKIIKLRKEIRYTLDELIHNKSPDLHKLNTLLQKYKLTFELKTKNRSTVFQFSNQEEKPEVLLLSELFNFFYSYKINRLKKCKNNNCSHYFLDKSRNNSRVWCSMKSCGNIMKAREFQRRSKQT